MVSFFGLKFGAEKEKKKRSDTPPERPARVPAQQWKKFDQNSMGEGQYFGQNLGNTTHTNGSIRSVTMPVRPGTAASMRNSPYAHPTHNMAASSMYDLSNVSHVRQGSYNSLKPTSSEANMRTNFGNGSMASLLAPGGYASRPVTPGGAQRNKPWVNPLDVHFNRAVPVPAPPKSPLANLEMGPLEEKAAVERSSLFGVNPEDVAQAIMASVEKQEEEEKARKERESIGRVEKEREERERRQRQQEEIERLQTEQEQLERERREKQLEAEKQRAAAAAAALRVPATAPALASVVAQARGPPGQQPSPPRAGHMQGPMRGPMTRPQLEQRNPSGWNGPADRPVFQPQAADVRPGSRNGTQPRPMDRPQFQGQGQTDFRPGSRAGPNERPRFQGQADNRPGSRNGGHDRPVYQPDHRGGSRNGHHAHHDRPVFQGQGQMDQRPGSRSGPRRDGLPSGSMNGPMHPRQMNGPGPMRGPGPGPANVYQRGPMPGTSHGGGRAREPQRGQTTFGGPTALPPPPALTSQSSQERFGYQDSKPVIRNVQARRDTLTMNTPRRSSLAMTIEAFERSIMDAQRDGDRSFGGSGRRRGSDASSRYSVDEYRSEPPSHPLPPIPPHRRPSPPYPTTAPRSESPVRRPMPGSGVQRPRASEYGVQPVRTSPESKARPVARAAAYATTGYPPQEASMEPAPLFRQPKWTNESAYDDGDFSRPRPAPTPSPKPNLTLHFAGPPTPDSTHNWPLPSPVPSTDYVGAPQLKRTNMPPPLHFDFSPNGYSREYSGPYTPPTTTRMTKSPGFLDEDPRSGAAGGLGIGVARGPSVREGRGVLGGERRPDFGLKAPTGIADGFGTPLI